MVGWCSMGTFNDPWKTTGGMLQTFTGPSIQRPLPCRRPLRRRRRETLHGLRTLRGPLRRRHRRHGRGDRNGPGDVEMWTELVMNW